MRLSSVMVLLVLVCTDHCPAMCRRDKKIRELELKVRKLEKQLKRCDERFRMRECPIGYIRSKSSCYKFVMTTEERRPWDKARAYCMQDSGNLVTINTEQKERFIRKFFEKNRPCCPDPYLLIFTGLIFTNSEALYPIDIQIRDHFTGSADSLRWTATKEAVQYENLPPRYDGVAEWSPSSFEGSHFGTSNNDLACAVLVWKENADNSYSLLWKFASCVNEALNFICEIQLPSRDAYKSSSRGRRSKGKKKSRGRKSRGRKSREKRSVAQTVEDVSTLRSFLSLETTDFVEEEDNSTKYDFFEEEGIRGDDSIEEYDTEDEDEDEEDNVDEEDEETEEDDDVEEEDDFEEEDGY